MKNKIICKNIFKNGETPPSKEEYTKAWVKFINTAESLKQNIFKTIKNYIPFLKDKEVV